MSRFTLTIDTDNDAFGDDPAQEVARILREAADRLVKNRVWFTYPSWDLILRDVNGNTIGKASIDSADSSD